ncbi:MAG: type II toxin-antitoxin system HicA family toxin [Phycisphaerales bacterium]
MGKLPRDLSGREVVGALVRLGFVVSRQRGSHIILHRLPPGTPARVVVPDHETTRPGTLKAVLREAGVSVEALLGALE